MGVESVLLGLDEHDVAIQISSLADGVVEEASNFPYWPFGDLWRYPFFRRYQG
jgi:hypothetical protein